MTKEDVTVPLLRSILLDILPIFSIIILILTTVLPDIMPSVPRLGALWPLIGITYWTLARPRGLKTPSLFALGLLMDIVSFVPLGVHAFLFVMMQILLNRQRRFLMGQSFWVLWTAYALLLLTVYVSLFILLSPAQPSAVGFTQGLVSVAIAWACAPLIVWLLNYLNGIIDLFDDPLA